MATTYEAIATVTVGSGGAANIEFTSIAADWTDLVLLVSARTTNNDTADDVNVYFNSTTSGYSGKMLWGNGSTATSNNDPFSFRATGATATANTFGSAMIYIPNYRSSTNKSYSGDSVTENNATSAQAVLTATLWSNTSAITSIRIDPEYGANLVQHSTATLYGIKNS